MQVEDLMRHFQLFFVLCKVKLAGSKIKRVKEVNEAWRIKSEKLRKKQYQEEYGRALESKNEMKSVMKEMRK